MAYVDRGSNTRRTATAIAVAAIQAGMIYAVATGLAVKFITPPERADPPDATNIRVTPIPPPEELNPEPAPKDQKTIQTRDPAARQPDGPPIPSSTGQASEGTGPVGGTGTGEGFKIDPPKDPPPPFAPRLARPSNQPGSWATPNDYPSRDLREGNQGATGFRLSIGADGKVLGCEITRSSGFASLDRTACDKITRRARFEPAMDGYGNKIPGSYSSTIRWQIPD